MIQQSHSWHVYGQSNNSKNTYILMFIAAPLTIAKMWKSSSRRMDEDVTHTHTHTIMEYYSTIKRMSKCHFQQHGWT